MSKCPPITKADIEDGVKAIEKTNMERARYLSAVGTLAIAVDLSKMISYIDQSRFLRERGLPDAADAVLDLARELGVGLLGLNEDKDDV